MSIFVIRIFSSYNGYIINSIPTEEIPEEFLKYGFFKATRREKALPIIKRNCTLSFVEFAKKHSIDTIGIEFSGAYGVLSFIDFDLLKANGIDIYYIKNKTPIPHNRVYEQAKRARRKDI